MEEMQTEPIEPVDLLADGVGNQEILDQLILSNEYLRLTLEHVLRLNSYSLVILAILIVLSFFVGLKAGK